MSKSLRPLAARNPHLHPGLFDSAGEPRGALRNDDNAIVDLITAHAQRSVSPTKSRSLSKSPMRSLEVPLPDLRSGDPVNSYGSPKRAYETGSQLFTSSSPKNFLSPSNGRVSPSGRASPSLLQSVLTSNARGLSPEQRGSPLSSPSSLFPPIRSSSQASSGSGSERGSLRNASSTPTGGSVYDGPVNADVDSLAMGETEAALFDVAKPIRLVHVLIEEDVSSKSIHDLKTLTETYRRSGDQKMEAEAIFRMGARYDRDKNYTAAILMYEKYARYCERVDDSNGLMMASNHLGVDFQLLGTPAALIQSTSWHQKHAELGDTAGKFVAYSNLGLVHKQQRDYSRAMDTLRTALTYARRMHSLPAESFIYSQLGTITQLMQGGSSPSPLMLQPTTQSAPRPFGSSTPPLIPSPVVDKRNPSPYSRAMNFDSEPIPVVGREERTANALDRARASSTLGKINSQEEEAEAFLRRHRELAAAFGDERGAGQASMQLGVIAHRTGRMSDAQQYMEHTRRVGLELGDTKMENEARAMLGIVRASERMEAHMREISRQLGDL